MCYVVVQLRNKLRVVPLSLISLCMTRKETSQQQQKKKMATRHPGGKKHVK